MTQLVIIPDCDYGRFRHERSRILSITPHILTGNTFEHENRKAYFWFSDSKHVPTHLIKFQVDPIGEKTPLIGQIYAAIERLEYKVGDFYYIPANVAQKKEVGERLNGLVKRLNHMSSFIGPFIIDKKEE